MLIPNNVNIYGKVKGADGLKDYKLRLKFPEDSAIGYVKQPLSNTVLDKKRVLTYKLEELLNFEAYWWLPLRGETEFSLLLNLLPPFPDLNPVDLQMSCRPDVATGLEASVTTTIRMEAEEQIDSVFLKLSAPAGYPGVSMAITDFSEDEVKEPRPLVTLPGKEFPFPRMGLKKGQALECKATTKITANPSSMGSLRCQQDILSARLLLLSESSPEGLPCEVAVLDDRDQEMPVRKTVRSTILQANAQVMYSPFSIRQVPKPERAVVVAPAQ